MRLNYMYTDHTLTMNDLQQACFAFFEKHKVMPDTVKIPYWDFSYFLSQFSSVVQTLETGKSYAQYINVPGRAVQLMALEVDGEEITYHAGGSARMLVVESSEMDREFEKHILNKDP